MKRLCNKHVSQWSTHQPDRVILFMYNKATFFSILKEQCHCTNPACVRTNVNVAAPRSTSVSDFSTVFEDDEFFLTENEKDSTRKTTLKILNSQNPHIVTSPTFLISKTYNKNTHYFILHVHIHVCVYNTWKQTHIYMYIYRLLDSLVVQCWFRVQEVPGSIPSQGPRHTKDVIKNGTSSSLVQH